MKSLSLSLIILMRLKLLRPMHDELSGITFLNLIYEETVKIMGRGLVNHEYVFTRAILNWMEIHREVSLRM